MSSVKFDTQAQFPKELKVAAISSKDYKDVKYILQSLKQIESALKTKETEMSGYLEAFKDAGGKIDSKEDHVNFTLNHAVVTLFYDKNGKIAQYSKIASIWNKEDVKFIQNAILACMRLPSYEHAELLLKELDGYLRNYNAVEGISALKDQFSNDHNILAEIIRGQAGPDDNNDLQKLLEEL